MKAYPTLLFPLALLVTACASVAPDETPEVEERAPATGEEPVPEDRVVHTPVTYDGKVLADLLIAETAVQRRNLELSLEHYARAARRTDSPAVRSRATRLASYMQDHALALEMAELWLAVEPASEALEMAALAEIGRGNPERATDYIDRLLAGDTDQVLARLVNHARGLDPTGADGLMEALGALAERYPDQPALWHARAVHRQHAERPEQALEAVDRALALDPDHVEARLLRGRLLHEAGETGQALEHLRELTGQFPERQRIRIAYVRLLLEAGDDDKAYEQLRELSRRHPGDQDLRYSLALYGLEHQAHETSRTTLRELLDEGYRPDEVRFYLARAAEEDGDPEAAIEHYMQVGTREQRFNARIQAARLLYETGRRDRGTEVLEQLRDHYPEHLPLIHATEAELLKTHGFSEQAMELLERALSELPGNRDLLYARALTAERLDRVEQALEDLARILDEDPDDAHALNARGYILTDRTERHEEARDYIERALALKPDNPAIKDSMGWVLFNLGRPEEALEYLREAWEAFPDGEVGAHLVEVLWTLGRRDEARELWERAREKNPESEHLEAVRERLLE